MSNYTALLHELSNTTFCESPPLELPGEIELQSHWFNGRFGRTFHDTHGAEVVIKQFGIWNRSAGPDFLNAVVEIDGKQLEGPIELDTHPSDWSAHGHSEDAAFSQTILHVVFSKNDRELFTRTIDHRSVRQVVIPESRIRQALQLHPFQQAIAHAGRCSFPLAQMDEKKLSSLLEQAAFHRVTQKAQQITHIAKHLNADEALWQSLAQTLGYKPNSFAMKLIAQRLPISELKKRDDIEALLFGIAGFLNPDITKNALADSRDYLLGLWDSWWRMRSDFALDESRAIPFRLVGIRPINHPQRRIAALAIIASKWKTFKKLCTDNDPDALITWLSELEHPFWSQHFTLTSKRAAKPMAMIGKNRATDFIVNHLLPSKITSPDDAYWKQYKQLPSSTDNSKLDRAIIRLLGQRADAARFTKKAWQQQALLQIYDDFCLQDSSDCQNCLFPEQLGKF